MKKSRQEVEKLKVDILDVAQEVFMTKNYSDTNIKDISDRLGVTRTPIYYHFNNKYEIYQQVTERYLDEKLQCFQDILLGEEDYFEKVRKDLTVCTQQAACENVLFGEILTNPELADILHRRKAVSEAIYRLKLEAIRMGKEKGELQETVDEDELASNLYLLHYGVIEMNKRTFHDFLPDMVQRLIGIHVENLKRDYGR